MARLCAVAGSDYVRWSGSVFTEFGGGGGYTLACWVKLTSGQGGFMLSGEPLTSTSVPYTALYVNSGAGSVHASCDHQSGVSSQSAANSAGSLFSLNAWQHIAGVFASQTSRQCYVNGVLRATDTADESTAWAGFQFVEACRINTNGATGTGTVAEVAIWVAALNALELDALWRGTPAHRVRPTALRLYWPLWGVATTEIDLAGQQRSGTVTGATVADHAPVGR